MKKAATGKAHCQSPLHRSIAFISISQQHIKRNHARVSSVSNLLQPELVLPGARALVSASHDWSLAHALVRDSVAGISLGEKEVARGTAQEPSFDPTESCPFPSILPDAKIDRFTDVRYLPLHCS